MSRPVAKKTDPRLWEGAKREAVRRLGGVHSARAMQLAVHLYKAAGGRYEGRKTGREGLSRWTQERWQTRPGAPKIATRGGTTARYLPAKAWASLTPAQQRATDAKKRRACRGKATCRVANTKAAKSARRASLRRNGSIAWLGLLLLALPFIPP